MDHGRWSVSSVRRILLLTVEPEHNRNDAAAVYGTHATLSKPIALRKLGRGIGVGCNVRDALHALDTRFDGL